MAWKKLLFLLIACSVTWTICSGWAMIAIPTVSPVSAGVENQGRWIRVRVQLVCNAHATNCSSLESQLFLAFAWWQQTKLSRYFSTLPPTKHYKADVAITGKVKNRSCHCIFIGTACSLEKASLEEVFSVESIPDGESLY